MTITDTERTDSPPRNKSRLDSSDSWSRITIRVPPDQLGAVEDLVDSGEYRNRSVAVRHALSLLTAAHAPTLDSTSSET
jgi:metal-responsive CopG/Arc/MetJ family transcriptional regulator